MKKLPIILLIMIFMLNLCVPLAFAEQTVSTTNEETAVSDGTENEEDSDTEDTDSDGEKSEEDNTNTDGTTDNDTETDADTSDDAADDFAEDSASNASASAAAAANAANEAAEASTDIGEDGGAIEAVDAEIDPLWAEEDDFEFDTDSGMITGYNGAGGEVYVPGVIDGIYVTKISESAFSWLRGINELTFSDYTIAIFGNAFYGARDLTTVNLGSGVDTFTGALFTHCVSLTEITTGADNTAFKAVDGVLYTADMKELLRYPEAKAEETFVIPDGVEIISDFAFMDTKALKSIVFPDSLQSIGDYSFANCSSLTSIDFGTGLISVGNFAFSDCAALTEAQILSPLEVIGDGAFDGCTALKKLYIPTSVWSIGRDVLSGAGKASIICAEGSYAEAYAEESDIKASYGDWYLFAFYDTYGHWARDYILELAELGIVSGYEDGTFRPNDTVTRAEFVKLMVISAMYELAPTNAVWYSGYYNYIYATLGVSPNQFPNDWEQPITRTEMAFIISTVLKAVTGNPVQAAGELSLAFADYDQFTIAVADVVEKGIMTGYADGTFGGDGNATRAEATTVISRCLTYLNK